MTNDFKILSDLEHIRLRFSMYGGSKDFQDVNVFVDGEFKTVRLVDGYLKVVSEILDNSIDEHVRTKGKYACNISVTVKDGIIEIVDDGRGIPVERVQTETGEVYQAVSAFTMARAGSNFDDSKREGAGMNGVGSAITFATSDLFEVKSGNGKESIHMKSTGGTIDSVKKVTSNVRGTYVKFKPSYDFFGVQLNDENHAKMVESRIKSLSLAYPSIRFKFNGKIVRQKFQDYFGETTIFANEKSTFGITKSSGTHETFTIVNGLSVKGGQHVETFMDCFMQDFRDVLKRKHKVDITRARLKNHLRIHAIVNGFKALKFDSQTKERVTNSTAECKDAIGEYDSKTIVKKLMANKPLIDEICAYTRLQDDLNAKKDLSKLEKKKKIKSDKYFAAIGPKTERIFVCEGDSANGGLIKCLGRQGQSFYALKGVPLNVLEVSHQKFMANKELSELYSIINSFPDADICIATDADADGSRICGLFTLFMYKYFPEYLNNGKLKVLKTPIAIGKKNNVVKEWAYSFDDVDKIDRKLDVQYQKGLGSWSERDLKYIIQSDTIEKMMPSVSIVDTELFDNWFGSSTIDFRKEQLLQSKPFNIMKA